jgi:hypothetical protein
MSWITIVIMLVLTNGRGLYASCLLIDFTHDFFDMQRRKLDYRFFLFLFLLIQSIIPLNKVEST